MFFTESKLYGNATLKEDKENDTHWMTLVQTHKNAKFNSQINETGRGKMGQSSK